MYYSAVIYRNHEPSTKILQMARQCEIELKAFFLDSESADFLLQALADNGSRDYELPVVLAGLDIVGHGDNAWFDFYCHSIDNPHVHWEADEGEDCI